MGIVTLHILAAADKQHSPLPAITELCAKHDCNIINSTMTTQQSEQLISATITANWSNIAKLESGISNLANDNLVIVSKRAESETTTTEENYLPYHVHIYAIDATGLAQALVSFFRAMKIDIVSFKTNTQISESTHTPVCTIQVSVNIPATANIADLRDQFHIFCDELNLDGILEPERR